MKESRHAEEVKDLKLQSSNLYLFLLQEKVLAMVHAVVLCILHPHPEGLGGGAMDAIVPCEVRGDGELDFNDGACDGLDAGCQIQHREGPYQLLHLATQPHVVHQVTCM